MEISIRRTELIDEERFTDLVYNYIKKSIRGVEEKDYENLCLNVDKELWDNYQSILTYSICLFYEVDINDKGTRSFNEYIADTNSTNKLVLELFRGCKIYTQGKKFKTLDGVIYYIADIVFRFVNSLPDRFPDNQVQDRYVFKLEENKCKEIIR